MRFKWHHIIPYFNSQNFKPFNISKKLDYIILVSAVVIFIVLQQPYFIQVQYPFRLLGTWFHEMGHGLTAICVGGQFKYLEIYENGGGVAYSTVTDKFLPLNIARALTAAGGLLGPAISGALLIAAAKSTKHAGILLRVLIGVMLLSLILWIRSYWGIVVLSAFILLFVVIILLKNTTIETITVLFLGLQCVFSTYLQLDYLFTKQFERHGAIQNSDTQTIAEQTFGSYLMWAIIIIIISAIVLWKSIRFYFKR